MEFKEASAFQEALEKIRTRVTPKSFWMPWKSCAMPVRLRPAMRI